MEPSGLHAELALTFGKQVDVCTALVSVLEEERQLLVNPDWEKLLGCLKRKEVLALKLRLLVDTVRQMGGRLAESVGLEANDLHLAEMLDRLDEPHRTAVRLRGEELRNLIQVMGDLTRGSDRILLRSLVNVERAVSLLMQLLMPGAHYTPAGKVVEQGISGTKLHRRV